MAVDRQGGGLTWTGVNSSSAVRLRPAPSAAPAVAQEAFPSRAITILNAFPPGGANDIVTRPVASALEPIFKQPVVVETKAGAAGSVGAQVAATAKPDGYTLLSHNNGLAGYAEVDKLFGRDAEDDARRFHPAGAALRRPGAAAGERAAAVEDAGRVHRRREEESGEDHLQLRRLLRREPSSGGDDRARGGPQRHAASADRGRRAGDHGGARQQCADDDANRAGHDLARQGRQAARARLIRSAALEGAARCSDHEGEGLRLHLLSVGRAVRPEGHARADRLDADGRDRQGRGKPAIQRAR